MLKIYLNGELEQSVYDVAIVNPEVKPSSVCLLYTSEVELHLNDNSVYDK